MNMDHSVYTIIIPLAFPPQQHPGSEPTSPQGTAQHVIAVLRKLAKKPTHLTRGAGVAVELILHTLAACTYKIKFIVPARFVSLTAAWLQLESLAGEVLSLEDAIKQRSLVDGDLWLDPAGMLSFTLRLRNFLGSSGRLPPLISFQHTLSVPRQLTEQFLTLTLEPTHSHDTLVCGSTAAKAALTNILQHVTQGNTPARFKGSINVVPLPVDTAKYCLGSKVAARKHLRLPVDAFICLYLGYLSPLKVDWPSVMQSVSKAIEHSAKNVILLLAGSCDPRYKPMLTKLSMKYPFIKVHGPIRREDKVHLYQAADLFFSPVDTLNESFGITPIEAMACGLPQLVSDWNGYRDTVIHGVTGFRINTLWEDPYNGSAVWGLLNDTLDHLSVSQQVIIDHDELSRLLKLMITDGEMLQAMGRASRERALKEYSHDVIRTSYTELIESRLIMSDAVNNSPPRIIPHTTDYFKCFKAYPTINTLEGLSIEVADCGCSLAESLELVDGDIQWLINRQLMTAILNFLETHASRLDIKEVCLLFSESHTIQPEVTWWHCCWLAKHGLLRFRR